MPGTIIVLPKKAGIPVSNIADSIQNALFGILSLRIDAKAADTIQVRITAGEKDSSGTVDTRDCFIAWIGKPLFKGAPISRENIPLDIDKETRVVEFVRGLQGHFQIVFYFIKKKEMYLFSDKISTHPFYYTETDDFHAVSPEAKSLLTLKEYDWKPTIRMGAIREFIANGFIWGDETYFNEIKRLGPGAYLKISSEGVQQKQYWRMVFEGLGGNKADLKRRLYEALRRDIELMPKGKAILTLSGGYDSRAILGLMKETGLDFRTVSYTFGLPYSDDSDAGVGRYFAEKSGVPFQFHQADISNGERVIADIEACIEATGGESDASCAQDALLGREFYRNLGAEYDYLLRGDELFGWEDHCINKRMACYEATLLNLNESPQPRKYLIPQAFSEGVDYIDGIRDKFSEEFSSFYHNFDELKDSLYWRHRQARLMGNMAYFRRSFIPHYAPFLFENTIETIKSVPSKYRINKNLFKETMRDCYPELFGDTNIPYGQGSKITKYELLFQNEALKSYIRDNLIVNPPSILADMLDMDLFITWVEKTLAIRSISEKNISERVKSNPIRSLAAKVIRKNRTLLAYSKAYFVRRGDVEMPYWQRDTSHIFRLLVLASALKKLEY